MMEDAIVKALAVYVADGTHNEQQLATLALDLIAEGGHDPNVVEYLNRWAGDVLERRDR